MSPRSARTSAAAAGPRPRVIAATGKYSTYSPLLAFASLPRSSGALMLRCAGRARIFSSVGFPPQSAASSTQSKWLCGAAATEKDAPASFSARYADVHLSTAGQWRTAPR